MRVPNLNSVVSNDIIADSSISPGQIRMGPVGYIVFKDTATGKHYKMTIKNAKVDLEEVGSGEDARKLFE